jgi:predicted CoA-substrate-specific enzyme activase
MLTVGVDIGSLTIKVAAIKDGALLGDTIVATGYDVAAIAQQAYTGLLTLCGVQPADVDRIVATGYGRKRFTPADQTVTEITCHAVGARFVNPEIRSVIDIGGQDSKVIAINAQGAVSNFAMNDKCAAGTGRFLEVMANALSLNLDAFSAASQKAAHPAPISNTCTVFAESEVISLVGQGEKRENIIAGIHQAIGARIAAMAARVGLTPPVMMTGGVAKNAGVVNVLEEKCRTAIVVSEKAQVIGAIGAALLAVEKT